MDNSHLKARFQMKCHRSRSVKEMRQTYIFLMLSLLMLACSCRQRLEHISHPLLAKYFRGTTNEVFWVLRQEHELLLVRHSLNGETKHPLSEQQLACALRDCRIPVSNEITAVDIGNLVHLLQSGNRPGPYLIEMATRVDREWIVQFRYWEDPPDDIARRSGGLIYTLMLNQQNLLTNVIVEALPPLLRLKTQNKASEDTSQ